MAYEKPSVTKHAVCFPSRILAGYGGEHQYNITLTGNVDNGGLIGRGAWNSFDNYTEAACPAGLTGKIVDQAANGNWYVEITAVPSTGEALLVYNSPIIPYEKPEDLADYANWYNATGETVRGYVLHVGDLYELSAEGFTGTPAKNATLTVTSKKWVIGS